jgi:hypothetical protein
MGSQLRRLRVKAGISGSFNRSRSRVVVPTFAKKQLDISFVDDLPRQFAIMPDREFSDGMGALQSELQAMLATSDYRDRIEAFGTELGQEIQRPALVLPDSREEIARQIQHVLRVMADRAEKEDR